MRSGVRSFNGSVWLPGSGDVDVGAAQDFAQGEADVDVCAEVDAPPMMRASPPCLASALNETPPRAGRPALEPWRPSLRGTRARMDNSGDLASRTTVVIRRVDHGRSWLPVRELGVPARHERIVQPNVRSGVDSRRAWRIVILDLSHFARHLLEPDGRRWTGRVRNWLLRLSVHAFHVGAGGSIGLVPAATSLGYATPASRRDRAASLAQAANRSASAG